MGYYIFSFGINKNEILNTFNSKDEEIIKKVEQNEYFENYNEQDDAKFTTKDALFGIIKGKRFKKKYGYTYGYALISLCATLGRELPYNQEIKLGYETEYINQILAEDFNIKDFDIEVFLFSEDKLSSFPIPNIDDFPMISVVKLQELKEIKSKLSNVIISDAKIEELQNSDDGNEEEKGYSYEHIKGIIDNINFCIENELDLLSACH